MYFIFWIELSFFNPKIIINFGMNQSEIKEKNKLVIYFRLGHKKVKNGKKIPF